MQETKEFRPFVAVPLVATVVWYVVTLAWLLIANGQLRLKTDVLALAIGAVIIGLPVSLAITILLGVPTYWLFLSTLGINRTSALAAGLGVGLAASLIIGALVHDWSLVSPLRGMLIGAVTTMAWWRMAKKAVTKPRAAA